jgi:hypothetical protein
MYQTPAAVVGGRAGHPWPLAPGSAGSAAGTWSVGVESAVESDSAAERQNAQDSLAMTRRRLGS